MRFSFRLPGGTLKIKSYRMMRSVEREGRIPMLTIGSIRVIWWSNANLERYMR